ncbi:16S rRNA (cytosine(967)-C(5))-methyltransferase RsmB [Terribacillus saccharophilus]|uniref:16S rRNA (cytosine(967)-C(5))-methyltransferase n=2 Tax=Terribacillus saccharophilus TaxID=361277 RepID=A0A268AAA2_9BACI|nr:16S rRNA (cytosine(967)-C(5))-methyltransferase RsmB [Terribacillus saccharophilus]PAD21054.1 16S rRNA (cytosine(967)-C(5))-methyltransferase [Terribacillus saccharophilus]PAF38327.1 16S rRNA (cytosine(967)-C(5))-methyltransferase [Terribacillus saccharophilus]
MKKYELRDTAVTLLSRIGDQGGYSHLLLDQTIRNKGFDSRDTGLLTEIVYGTLSYKLTLEYFLRHFVSKKLESWAKWLLLSAFYQMYVLDRVPDHAVIHESVEIAKQRGHKGIASLVNAVLRNAQRKGFPKLDDIQDPAERISLETSHPKWLVERWIAQYGEKTAREMCAVNQVEKPISVRVQPMLITRDEAMEELESQGFTVRPSSINPQGIIVEDGNILKSDLFLSNQVTVQDQTSMLAGQMVDATAGMTVLDACSAPGGKTTHIAETMENEGKLYAYDLHAKKAKQVQQKAEKLKLTIIEADQADARNLHERHQPESFDRILLDAPCSGLGVLRGKPDIKYHKSEQDVLSLASIQADLLEQVAPLLKKDGKLVYSTCTVDQAENEQVVRAFLEQHPDFEVDPEFQNDLPQAVKKAPGLTDAGLQVFPQDFNTDGFFLVRLVRKG